MLTSFRVENFKTIEKAEEGGEPLRFSGLNVLIGPNGVGKTSLLQAIDFLRAFFGGSIDDYLKDRGWSYDDIPNLRQGRKKISWYAEFIVPPNQDGCWGGAYELEISLVKRRYLNVGNEKLTYRSGQKTDNLVLINRMGRATILQSRNLDKREHYSFYQLPSSVATYIERSPDDEKKFPEIVHFLEYIKKIRQASIFDVEQLRSPATGYAEEIGPKGQKLVPFLARLQSKAPEKFENIRNQAKRMFPNITDFTIKGHAASAAPKTLEVYEGKTVFNSSQVSDGFLRVLAVIALYYAPNPPSILLFEEPENGVHPRLMRSMVNVFRDMTRRKGPFSTQVFLTTHSPYLLDEFHDHPEQVYTVRREGAGRPATFRRLDHIFPNGVPEQPLGESWYGNGFLGA